MHVVVLAAVAPIALRRRGAPARARREGRRPELRRAASRSIVALGVAVRVVHTLLVAPWPPEIFNDEAYYNTLAQLIARGEGFIRPGGVLRRRACALPTAERAPLFPLALAGLAELGITRRRRPPARSAHRRRHDRRCSGCWPSARRRARRPDRGRARRAVPDADRRRRRADDRVAVRAARRAGAAGRLPAGRRAGRRPRARRSGAVAGLAALVRAEALILLPLAARAAPAPPRRAARRRRRLRWPSPWCSPLDDPQLERLRPPGADRHRGRRDAGRRQLRRRPTTATGSATWSVAVRRVLRARQRGGGAQRAGPRGDRVRAGPPGPAAARGGRAPRPHLGAYGPFDMPGGPRAVGHVRSARRCICCCCRSRSTASCSCAAAACGAWIIATPFVTVTLATLLAYGSVRFRHSAELAIVVLAAVAARPALARGRAAPWPCADR